MSYANRWLREAGSCCAMRWCPPFRRRTPTARASPSTSSCACSTTRACATSSSPPRPWCRHACCRSNPLAPRPKRLLCSLVVCLRPLEWCSRCSHAPFIARAWRRGCCRWWCSARRRAARSRPSTRRRTARAPRSSPCARMAAGSACRPALPPRMRPRLSHTRRTRHCCRVHSSHCRACTVCGTQVRRG